MGTPLVESVSILGRRHPCGRHPPLSGRVVDGADQLPCAYLGTMGSWPSIRNEKIGQDFGSLFADFTKLSLRWIRGLSFL